MQRKIVLSHSILQEVERLQANNKISAIKLVRKHGKAYPAAEGHNEPHSVGLREAKEAVEHAYTPSRIDNRTPCAVFGAGFRVKKLLVEIAGEGSDKFTNYIFEGYLFMEKMEDYLADEDLISAVLDEMTPLERDAHNAMLSVYMIGSYGFMMDVIEQIKEVDALRNSTDLEDRSLLPLAEAALHQLICELPTQGDA